MLLERAGLALPRRRLHPRVVADELDRVPLGILDEERPPMEEGELLRRHREAQAFELASAGVVVVEVDDECEMVERRALRPNVDATVEQDERLGGALPCPRQP